MRSPGRTLRIWLSTLAAAVVAASTVQAVPHLPDSDDEIVETLPVRLDPELSAVAELRGQWLRDPADAAAGSRLVRAYIAAARRNGDPRFLGLAEAVLARYGSGATQPIELRVLHATVLQSLHRFDAAIVELSAVLSLQPEHAQALLTRATVLQVRGRFAEARRDCSQLWRSAGEITTALCLASVAAVTGGERAADGLAAHALQNARAGDLATQVWASTLRAEIAARQGEPAAADQYFRQALAADPGDRYARAAYCDLLLDRGKPEAVITLTTDSLRDDNLLLRHALALQKLANRSAGRGAKSSRELAADIERLRERHAAARLRGDRTHLREEARMQLELLHDPAAALRAARENWAAQSEPADLRVLLAAAAATGDELARVEVMHWLRVTGLHDVGIEAMLEARQRSHS